MTFLWQIIEQSAWGLKGFHYWFSTLNTTHLVYFSHLTQLVDIIRSLAEPQIPKLGVSDTGDIQNVSFWGISEPALRPPAQKT